MKVLLTGGSGDLGRTLVPRLLDMGHTPVILDVRAPRDLKQGAVFIEGSILSAPHACSWISPDSPLERRGFELPVPPARMSLDFSRKEGAAGRIRL
jgi:NAD(P)-dependent dehydrogenase (short-subunit alcohol dehydrogenase family)